MCDSCLTLENPGCDPRGRPAPEGQLFSVLLVPTPTHVTPRRGESGSDAPRDRFAQLPHPPATSGLRGMRNRSPKDVSEVILPLSFAKIGARGVGAVGYSYRARRGPDGTGSQPTASGSERHPPSCDLVSTPVIVLIFCAHSKPVSCLWNSAELDFGGRWPFPFELVLFFSSLF